MASFPGTTLPNYSGRIARKRSPGSVVNMGGLDNYVEPRGKLLFHTILGLAGLTNVPGSVSSTLGAVLDVSGTVFVWDTSGTDRSSTQPSHIRLAPGEMESSGHARVCLCISFLPRCPPASPFVHEIKSVCARAINPGVDLRSLFFTGNPGQEQPTSLHWSRRSHSPNLSQ